MSISDLIKNKFVEEFTAISVGTLLTTLLLSFALGLFVLVIYRVTYGGVSFSKSFALSLVMLSMVTALAILTVRSNVVLSLGMVGALSIVRFRTAIKDPMDTVFMFWSIVIGIITGAGYITVAILAALLLGALFLALLAVLPTIIYAIAGIIFIIFHRKCLVSDISEGTIATVSDGFHGISDRTVKIKNSCFYHKITSLL